jgi:hypothetical protein
MSKMQSKRTLTLVVLCVIALCCAEVVLAANSVIDTNGRIWCVRSEMSPAPVMGQEIYLYDEEGTFGEFITMDKALDASPHVYLTNAGKIGIVWSRENTATGRLEICSTVYDQESGLWVHPFTILTSPQGSVDHTDPRLEVSPSGIVHLVYVTKTVAGGRTDSSLRYRIKLDGGWSEPSTVSMSDEIVGSPELYLGASPQGYPLVLVYTSSPYSDGIVLMNRDSQSQTIKTLQKNGSDPDPWMVLLKHRLPINLR